MAITLGAIPLPDTLVWEDEFEWTPIQETNEFSLTGVPIVQQGVKQAGRPITLTGKSDGTYHTGALTRSALMALQTALSAAGATFTLALHDGRTFTVAPRHEAGALDAEPLPVFRSFSAANPASDRLYLIRSLKLQTTS